MAMQPSWMQRPPNSEVILSRALSLGMHEAARTKLPAEKPFILTAMLSIVCAAGWMALKPELFLSFYYSAEFLAQNRQSGGQ